MGGLRGLAGGLMLLSGGLGAWGQGEKIIMQMFMFRPSVCVESQLFAHIPMIATCITQQLASLSSFNMEYI